MAKQHLNARSTETSFAGFFTITQSIALGGVAILFAYLIVDAYSAIGTTVVQLVKAAIR